MKRIHLLGIAGLVGLSALLALLAGGPSRGSESSALSSGAGGLLAARLYLEARGTPTLLLDRSLDASRALSTSAGSGKVLVVSFPWQRVLPGERLRALDDHLLAGGTLLVAYTGQIRSVGETGVVEALGLSWQEVEGGRLSLDPWRWRAEAGKDWLLEPDSGLADAPSVRISAPRRVPVAPPFARVLFRRGGQTPVIFTYPRGRGEVIVLPAQALANGRLAEDGNADLLEALRVRLAPARWVFDEYHHGLSAATSPEAERMSRVFDLYLAHLALAYVLGVLTLARRFGPAWVEAPATTGSVGSFLVGLGALHHRLGHHREAADLMVSRALELDPRLHIARNRLAVGKDELVRVGKEVAEAQARKGSRG